MGKCKSEELAASFVKRRYFFLNQRFLEIKTCNDRGLLDERSHDLTVLLIKSPLRSAGFDCGAGKDEHYLLFVNHKSF